MIPPTKPYSIFKDSIFKEPMLYSKELGPGMQLFRL